MERDFEKRSQGSKGKNKKIQNKHKRENAAPSVLKK